MKTLRERVRCKDRWPERGDEWSLCVNHGTIYRWVKSVTRDGTISYTDSIGRFCQCSWDTWRRWARDAFISYRSSWAEESSDARAAASAQDDTETPQSGKGALADQQEGQ